MTALFRIGQRRRRSVVLRSAAPDPDATPEVGAPHPAGVLARTIGELDVAHPPESVPDCVAEVVGEIEHRGLADGEIVAEVSTDDLALRIEIRYEGRPLDRQPLRPLEQDDLTDENVIAVGTSRFLDAPRPDDLTVRRHGDEVHLSLVYELV